MDPYHHSMSDECLDVTIARIVIPLRMLEAKKLAVGLVAEQYAKKLFNACKSELAGKYLRYEFP